MLSKVFSAAVHGIEGYPVTVEIDVRPGLPSFTIVGLPDAGVKESRERVIAAIRNSGFSFPPQRITVNLAPAYIRKEGPSFDFPIAVGILAAAGVIPREVLDHRAFLGELGLNGELRVVGGVLPCTIGLRKRGVKEFLLPQKNGTEAAIVDGLAIYPVADLEQAIQFLIGAQPLTPMTLDRASIFNQSRHYTVDFSDVKGQRVAKRALEIAAAGGHNILLLWTQNHKKRNPD